MPGQNAQSVSQARRLKACIHQPCTCTGVAVPPDALEEDVLVEDDEGEEGEQDAEEDEEEGEDEGEAPDPLTKASTQPLRAQLRVGLSSAPVLLRVHLSSGHTNSEYA